MQSYTSSRIQEESVLDAEESILRTQVFLLPVLGLAEAEISTRWIRNQRESGADRTRSDQESSVESPNRDGDGCYG